MKEEFERPSEFYHGSPHEFDKFDLNKVGTGDGLNKFGFGLYFSDSYQAAAFYARELSIGNMRAKGFNMYTVKLFVLDDYIGWDDNVDSNLISEVANRLINKGHTDNVEQMLQETEEQPWTLRNLYEWLEAILDDKKEVTRLLNLCGVNGIITPDAFHGGNIYVAFSDDMVKIIDVKKLK